MEKSSAFQESSRYDSSESDEEVDMPSQPPSRLLIRQASFEGNKQHSSCWCGEQLPCNLRLGCRCLVHYDCLVELIKSWVRDINQIQEWGITCPYLEACEHKINHGRSYYITESNIHDIITYGNDNASKVTTFLSDEDIELFKRLKQEKCVRLACGCYVNYETLVKIVREGLVDADALANEGIRCPNHVSGKCEGGDGIYLSRFDISQVLNKSMELRKKKLLPSFSPRSDPKHLSNLDVDDFYKMFDRHVRLGCNCLVHVRTAMKCFQSALGQTTSSAHPKRQGETKGQGVSNESGNGSFDGRGVITVAPEVAADFLPCPHGKFCENFMTTGTAYNMTPDDIDAVIAFHADLILRGTSSSGGVGVEEGGARGGVVAAASPRSPRQQHPPTPRGLARPSSLSTSMLLQLSGAAVEQRPDDDNGDGDDDNGHGDGDDDGRGDDKSMPLSKYNEDVDNDEDGDGDINENADTESIGSHQGIDVREGADAMAKELRSIRTAISRCVCPPSLQLLSTHVSGGIKGVDGGMGEETAVGTSDLQRNLRDAVAEGQLFLAMLLMMEGADPLAKLHDGCTLLHVACAGVEDHCDVARMLLNCGVDVEAPSPDGLTALEMAARAGHSKTVSVLLRRSAHAQSTDPLHGSNLDIGGDTAPTSEGAGFVVPTPTALLGGGQCNASEMTEGNTSAFEGAIKSTGSAPAPVGASSAIVSSTEGDGEEVATATALGIEGDEGRRGDWTSEQEFLNGSEVDLLKRWCIEALQVRKSATNSTDRQQSSSSSSSSMEKAGAAEVDGEALFLALREATTKKCPECRFPQTHYHGHHCHHVREGCLRCKTHFCYRCLSTAEENRTLRGSDHLCMCGGWSSFCSEDHIIENLKMDPYPHDIRCGCPLCPECRPGKPCQGCGGSCVVCRNIVNPGPEALAPAAAVSMELQTEEQRAKYLAETKRRELFAACRRGDVAVAESLMENFSTDHVDDTDMTLLHWSSLCGHVHVVRILIEAVLGVHERVEFVNRRDAGGSSALHYAVHQGHIAVTICLLYYGAALNEADNDKAIPLVNAIRSRDEDMAFLIMHRMEAAHDTYDVKAAFLGACEHGLARLVAILLRRPKVDVNKRDVHGRSPLMLACAGGHEEVAALLLRRRARVDRKLHGKTPLLVASQFGHLRITKMLLKHGAQINKRDKGGKCPLLAACENGHAEIVSLLLRRGAIVNNSDNKHKSPLLAACVNGNKAIVRLLLEKGADVDQVCDPEDLRHFPLLVASQRGDAEMVSMLLAKDADVNVKGGGQTALIAACIKGSVDIVATLLDHKADPRECGYDYDSMGDSEAADPLLFACRFRHKEIFNLLLDRCDNLDLSTCGRRPDVCHQFTALHWCVLHGEADMLMKLIERGAPVHGTCSHSGGHRHQVEPIDVAVEIGSIDMLGILLNRGGRSGSVRCTPNVFVDQDWPKWTLSCCLINACQHGRVEMVRWLLNLASCGENCNEEHTEEQREGHFKIGNSFYQLSWLPEIDYVDCRNMCPLTAALCGPPYGDEVDTNRQSEVVTLLLERGAAVDPDLPSGAVRPLVLAAREDNVELVTTLLDGGAVCSSDVVLEACQTSSIAVLPLLLERGGGMDATNNKGMTPLMSAAKYCLVDVIRILLAHGADTEERWKDGATSLLLCTGSSYSRVLRKLATLDVLLGGGARVDARDNKGNSALLLACVTGSEEGREGVVARLLAAGAGVDDVDDGGNTPLMRVCGQPEPALNLARLLLEHGASANIKNEKGECPLSLIGKQGDNVDLVLSLLRSGAHGDVEWAGGPGKVIHWASGQDCAELVALLLQNGANGIEWSKAGMTTLGIASEAGRVEVVRALLDGGVSVNVKDKSGQTAVQRAVGHGHSEVVRLLLDRGASLEVHFKDKSMSTLLHVASAQGNTGVVALLLERGLKVNQQCRDGSSALMEASAHGHEEVVALLLERGAKVDAQQRSGASALSLAKGNNHAQVVSLLLSRGATPVD